MVFDELAIQAAKNSLLEQSKSVNAPTTSTAESMENQFYRLAEEFVVSLAYTICAPPSVLRSMRKSPRL
jgi:methionyl-tRNA formyltransferase